MYKNGFVVFISQNSNVLREREGSVSLPFGSEYEIGLKNTASKRAVVSVFVDGEDVLDGKKIVLNANSDMNLLGFMDGMVAKNRFRFIEKTEKIENHRGNKPEDGLIRVQVQFEKPLKFTPVWTIHNDWDYPKTYWNGNYTINSTYSGGRGTSSSLRNIPMAAVSDFSCMNEDGITVKGEEIKQDFYSTYVGELESEVYTLVLKLSGYCNNEKVSKPFTVKDKLICEICGTENSYRARFCNECGAFIKNNKLISDRK